MSAIESTRTYQPVDAVLERLNDPTVAASLVTLLDNVELLSTLTLGLAGFIERSDTIIDSVADGVAELKAAGLANETPFPLPTPAELTALTAAMAKATPVITDVLGSAMVTAETVALLSLVTEAAAEGAERARTSETSVIGLRAAVRLLKDPEVGRGLGFIVEVARALGRGIGSGPTERQLQ